MKTGPRGPVIRVERRRLPVQGLYATHRRGTYGRGFQRDAHIMDVVKQVSRGAVQAHDAAGRPRAPIITSLGAAVAAPIDFHYQVGFPVILERRTEREPEPGVRRGRHRLGNLGIDQGGRIAAVVGCEIPGEGRTRRVAEFYLEVVKTPGGDRGRSVPLPLLYGPLGDCVRRQNQVLAPQGIAASTPVERVVRFRGFGADDEQVGGCRSRNQHRDAR